MLNKWLRSVDIQMSSLNVFLAEFKSLLIRRNILSVVADQRDLMLLSALFFFRGSH